MSSPQSGASPATAAFFDLDGTLAHSTIVHYYAFFKRHGMPTWLRWAWSAGYLIKCLGFLILDAYDRRLFNEVFYRSYRGLSSEKIKALAETCFEEVLRPRVFVGAVKELERFKREGRRAVLVTGSLDFIVEPFARAFGMTDVIAAKLEEKDGRFTGRLVEGPLCDRAKADRIKAFAEKQNIDLAASYAYGDSAADFDMLKAVGHGVLVNAESRKRRMLTARERGWTLIRWTQTLGRRADGGRP